MRILALDMATATGWAHSCGASGVWDLRVKADESSGMRLIRFEAKVHEVAQGVGIDLIVFEAVTVNSGKKANTNGVKLASKLQAIIERLSEVYDYECCSCNLATLKSYAIPGVAGQKVKRDKGAMIAAAKAKWPDVDMIDDNHADALWLLDWAQSAFAHMPAS